MTKARDLANVVSAGGGLSTSQVDLVEQGDLRLQDTTGGQYVALQAPGTVSSSFTLTLPAADGTSGQVLQTDGSGVLSFVSAGGASDYQEFTSSGTYTKPSGVNYIYVEGVGGGGGGAVGNFSGDGAGGGGGGAFVAKLFRNSDVGSTETVTIGAGGAGSGSGGGSGANGGDSAFGSLLTAKGGKGGLRNNTLNSGDPYSITNFDSIVSTPSYSGLGGVANANGGNTIYGGGGGAGAKTLSKTGGTSVYGGAGGDSAIGSTGSNGVQPGGGGGAVDGGAAAGSGAAGRIRVWAW